MRIKTLFSIPKGEKVTEKALRKVLISSVCSILLCMTCLVSTTWAWFAVSIENTENVIQIATIKETVTIANAEDNTVIELQNGTYTLVNGIYNITVSLVNDATGPDGLNKQRSPAYVLLSVKRKGGTEYVYFAFEEGDGEQNRTLKVNDESVTLNFSVSWMRPASATLIDDDGLTVGEIPTESVTTTEATEITTAAIDETTTTTPTETTEPTTGTEETTVPAEIE